jgi:hypothetical protein
VYAGSYRVIFGVSILLLATFPILVIFGLIKCYGIQTFQFFRGAAKTSVLG